MECIEGAPYSGLERLTVCCYESYFKVRPNYLQTSLKIFIDEAHHIKVPALYQNSLLYEHPDTDSDSDQEEEEEALSNPRKRAKKQSTKKVDTSRQYSVCISKLAEHRNTVWASATIDEIPTFRYYQQPLRTMIERGYLCDYDVHIPVFSKKPQDKLVCQHLLDNYSSMIVFLFRAERAKQINHMLNVLSPGSSALILCSTSAAERKRKIQQFKSGELLFLVNVGVLIEGFDAPNCKGCCLLDLSHSPRRLIQNWRICARARKRVAHIASFLR